MALKAGKKKGKAAKIKNDKTLTLEAASLRILALEGALRAWTKHIRHTEARIERLETVCVGRPEVAVAPESGDLKAEMVRAQVEKAPAPPEG